MSKLQIWKSQQGVLVLELGVLAWEEFWGLGRGVDCSICLNVLNLCLYICVVSTSVVCLLWNNKTSCVSQVISLHTTLQISASMQWVGLTGNPSFCCRWFPTMCADIIIPDASLMWDEQLMKSPPCSGYQWGDKTLDMTSVCIGYCIHSSDACRPDPEYSLLFYPQNSPPALSIVKNASHARKTDFSHEKTCCIMDPWLITGGVAGSEPTNLVFCRYFERRSFSINPAKNRRGGGEGTICSSIPGREVARILRGVKMNTILYDLMCDTSYMWQ